MAGRINDEKEVCAVNLVISLQFFTQSSACTRIYIARDICLHLSLSLYIFSLNFIWEKKMHVMPVLNYANN